MLSRRGFLKASLGLTGLALLSGCRHTVQIGSPALVFRQGETGCGTGDGESEIVGAVGVIRFSGAVTTPDPCHRLEAMLESANDLLIVQITARSSLNPNEFCV
ncbi:MAG: twin-arginine translocation signal domain-containing protein, partial [Candidatus Bipolaricaulota bacterium]|nr:twin-arginine translocation signal domain-containing protein [Candidatus Bipolaricaulota bacterium]MDW8141622.1 twin-arginine translocation signal domain-containing protein [Candidatus Bipolaricaulota bacterium]